MENTKMKRGFVLYEGTTFNFTKLKEILKSEWDIDVNGEEKDNTLLFNVGNNIIKLSFMDGVVPEGEAEKCAKNNLFWEKAVEEVKKHNTHLIAEISGGKDPVKTGKLFVKIASAALMMEKAIGIYVYPTVMEAKMYIDIAQEIKENEFPLLDLVYFGFYKTDNGICGYTEGMNFFDKKEIEIVDSDIDFTDVFDFLIDVANYVIVSDVKLNDGETIGFSPEQKLPITVSEGVSVEGDSVKIGFEKANLV